MDQIGIKLRKVIEASGLTMSEISKCASIPTSTLSGIVNGKFRNISIQKVKAICDTVGCTLDYLLDDNRSPQSEWEVTFGKLNSEYQKIALVQIKALLNFQNDKEET